MWVRLIIAIGEMTSVLAMITVRAVKVIHPLPQMMHYAHACMYIVKVEYSS